MSIDYNLKTTFERIVNAPFESLESERVVGVRGGVWTEYRKNGEIVGVKGSDVQFLPKWLLSRHPGKRFTRAGGTRFKWSAWVCMGLIRTYQKKEIKS